MQLLARPEYFLATTLLGGYMAAAANTVLVTVFFLGLFGKSAEIPVMIILPPLLLIFGEIIPKSIGRQQATPLAERLAPILWAVSWVIYPITWIFAGLSRLILLLAGVRKTGQLPFITREDLSLVVTKSGPEVDIKGKERLFIHRILQFSQRTVKEVMVPLIRVTAIPDTLTIAQAQEEFRNTQFSRLPVYHRRIDNLIGVLHSFDLLGEEHLERPIKPLIRPVKYEPELKKIDRLLAEMQREGSHLAVVVDSRWGLWVLARDGQPDDGFYADSPLLASLVKTYIRHDLFVQRIYADFPAEMEEQYGPGLVSLTDFAAEDGSEEERGLTG
ncbi:MAG: hypothetical protein B7Z74_07920 [Deltaproteobacteria bacterium 21-66-5]|nr:MAG: hypothetical protein B7Z74_07920 [Deltaproteobacteria bacterium 21-66-5]